MIDQIDARLTKWVEEVVTGVRPSFAPPSDAEDGLAISLYLLEIADDPLRHSTGHPTIQPSLRYLVTTRAGEPQDAHHLLGLLFYAAKKHPEFEVELEKVDTELWSAFGIAPRPAFILRLPLPDEWPTPQPEKAPPVTQELAPVAGELVPLYGLVVGPNDTPLASVRVEMIVLWERPENPAHLQEVPLTTNYSQLERAAYTDRKGRFTLPGIQAAPAAKTLLVRARGQEQIFIVRETGAPEAPVVFPIRLETG
jgi:hypothetical protein